MDRDDLALLGSRLTASGVVVTTDVYAGGNVVGQNPVAWEAALVRCMRAFGWRFHLAAPPEPAELPPGIPERYGRMLRFPPCYGPDVDLSGNDSGAGDNP